MSGEVVHDPELAAQFSASGLRVAIVASKFNISVTEKLVAGAVEALRQHGRQAPEVFWVPGAFDLPLVARKVARKGFAAVVCVGAVIRGETAHFDYVAAEAARGIAQAAWDTAVPITFGVLTTDTLEQARERAGGMLGNKGYDAAVSAMELALVHRRLDTMFGLQVLR